MSLLSCQVGKIDTGILFLCVDKHVPPPLLKSCRVLPVAVYQINDVRGIRRNFVRTLRPNVVLATGYKHWFDFGSGASIKFVEYDIFATNAQGPDNGDMFPRMEDELRVLDDLGKCMAEGVPGKISIDQVIGQTRP